MTVLLVHDTWDLLLVPAQLFEVETAAVVAVVAVVDVVVARVSLLRLVEASVLLASQS